MNWPTPRKCAGGLSNACGDYRMHVSLLRDNEIFVTVYRINPFIRLGNYPTSDIAKTVCKRDAESRV